MSLIEKSQIYLKNYLVYPRSYKRIAPWYIKAMIKEPALFLTEIIENKLLLQNYSSHEN